MGVFVDDSFTDTAGTLLADHTGETGATWTNHPNAESTDWQISDANRLRGNATSGGSGYIGYASGLPASGDYEVTAVLTVKSLNNLAGVLGRLSTSAYTCYEATYLFEGVDAWRLAKRVAAVFTSLGTFPQTLSDEGSYTVKLRMAGTTISLWVDGIEQITVTDGDITAAGRAGVYIWGTQITPSNTESVHIDSVNAADVTVGSLFIQTFGSSIRPSAFAPGLAR